MKILMLTPYLPYPDSSGGQIRTQNLLKHLKKDHDITLFSLIKHHHEEKYVKILEENFCTKVKVFDRPAKPWMLSNILKTGFSLNPFLVVRNFSQAAKKAIEEELISGEYDLIHAETFYAMPHIPKTNIPIVLVDQTIEYKVYEHYVYHTAHPLLRPLLSIDVAKLKFWERHYWRLADKVIAVSEQDKEEMLAVEPNLSVDIVPNGVNMELFKPKTQFNDKCPTLLFVGNFTWLQNTEAAKILIDEIYPIVKKHIPNVKLHIIGQHQPESLMAYNSKDIFIEKLAEDDSQSIVSAYHDASVLVTPIWGPGGTRLKVLGAMASKLPIISTSVGVSGLAVRDNIHVLIKDHYPAMAKAIINLLTKPEKSAKLAQNAYDFVKQNYDYKKIALDLSNIYRSLI